MNIALWILQVLLALAFLAAGIPKTFQPIDSLAKRLPWTKQAPVALVRFIGIAETLGAIGLILPELTHILPWLTLAAAIGLALAMVCAAVFHLARREYMLTFPSVILLLLVVFFVYGRLALSPLL
jgi:putative oxidoreductase